MEAQRIPRLDGDGAISVTVSLGVAASTAAPRPRLIAAADRALYEAKQPGKNRTERGAAPRHAGAGVTRVPRRLSKLSSQAMGILDEAIREHLDLKRSRGADPSEVTRQEHEALGPVRREPAGDAAPEEAAPGGRARSRRPSRPRSRGTRRRADRRAAGRARCGRALRPSADLEPEGARARSRHRAPGRARAAAPAPPAAAGDRGVGLRRRGARGAAPRQPEEDVLEETPEFLQETPEHDRLWFEQKPPRDFDFDG